MESGWLAQTILWQTWTEATYTAMHPAPHPHSSIPQLPDRLSTSPVTEGEIAQAIKSFPNRSTGRPDGLRPQHLKDLIATGAGGGCEALLRALVPFIELVLSGNTPVSIRPFFFGANLIALQKRMGVFGQLQLAAPSGA